MKGRRISKGIAEGEVLLSSEPISFFGGVDPATGIITEPNHCLHGRSIAGKILVFPRGKGSTVGSYTLYRMKKAGVAPRAIVNAECETIVAVGAIISEIPLVDKLPIDPVTTFHNGQRIRVNGSEGTVENLDAAL